MRHDTPTPVRCPSIVTLQVTGERLRCCGDVSHDGDHSWGGGYSWKEGQSIISLNPAPHVSARTVTRYSIPLHVITGRRTPGFYDVVPASEVDHLLTVLAETEALIAIYARALGEDSTVLRDEVTRRREAFRNVLLRAEKAEAALAEQAQEIERLRQLSNADIAQIIEGIEHFIMNGDPAVDAIWQPYVDKLAALRAVPQTEPQP